MTPAVFFPSYSKFVCYDCLHIKHVPSIFCAHLIIFFWSVELGHYYVYATFGILTLCNLCKICNSNRFHSFIFKIYIMIVHTLKMCTGDAGPEQSLVLLTYRAVSSKRYKFVCAPIKDSDQLVHLHSLISL